MMQIHVMALALFFQEILQVIIVLDNLDMLPANVHTIKIHVHVCVYAVEHTCMFRKTITQDTILNCYKQKDYETKYQIVRT